MRPNDRHPPTIALPRTKGKRGASRCLPTTERVIDDALRPMRAAATLPPTTAGRAARRATLRVAGKPTLARGVRLAPMSNEAGTAKPTLKVGKLTARKLKLNRKAKGAVTVATPTASCQRRDGGHRQALREGARGPQEGASGEAAAGRGRLGRGRQQGDEVAG